MDQARIKAWTRRRVGLAAGGLLATLAGIEVLPPVAAKHHHHKKKRCTKTESRCGTKCVAGTCCPGKACGLGTCRCTRAIEGDAFCQADEEVIVDPCADSGDCSITERCIRLVAGGTTCVPRCPLV